jgi:outer membrane protein assembly factor BamB
MADVTLDTSDADADALICNPIVHTGSSATTLQIDVAHTGWQPNDVLSLPLCKRWEAGLGADVSYAVVGDGHVFVEVGNYGQNQSIYALNEQTGAVIWGPVSIGMTFAGLALGDTDVYAVTFACEVIALDTSTGVTTWSATFSGSNCFGGAIASAERLYLNREGMGTGLTALDATDGGVIWAATTSLSATPSLANGRLSLTGGCELAYAYDLNGNAVWQHANTCIGGANTTAPVHAGRVYDRDPSGSSIIDLASGATVGTFASDQAPAFGENVAVFVQGGALVAVNPTTSALSWTYPAQVVLAPIVVGDHVVAATAKGEILVLDAPTGALVSAVKIAASIPPPVNSDEVGLAAADGMLFVPNGSHLVAF